MSSSKSSPSKTSIIISKFKASIEEEPPIGNIQSIMSSDEQYLFMHILDCMGALSCTRADQKAKNVNDEGDEALRSNKYGVFWRTVREIAEQEALLEDNQAKMMETCTPIPKNVPFDFVLNSFPEDSKLSDGLPLDFAISLPNISLADIETLFTAHSVAVQACRDQSNVVNPCHLAAMTRLEVIQQLQNYFPHIGVSLASESYTPLHLAASYSNSVAMVRKLAELHPAALGAKNSNGDTPLHLAARYSNSAAMVRELAHLHPAALGAEDSNWDTPLHVAARYSNSVAIVRELTDLHPAALERMNAYCSTPLAIVASYISSETLGKLQVLLDAAPQAARMANIEVNNCLPLHHLLIHENPPATLEMVAIVLAAYRDAVNISTDNGWLPIHCAAATNPNIGVLKMIVEENMSPLSLVVSGIGSLAHCAVYGYRFENLQYIHSQVPDILMTIDSSNNTPLHRLRHKYEDGEDASLCSPLSAASDILRYLLRHCPSLATAKNSFQQTLYDLLPAEDAGLAYARRLLLLAGASSLYPGALQELNYAARREALLLFYSAAPPTKKQRSIISRIRYGAGGTELMRTIVCFL